MEVDDIDSTEVERDVSEACCAEVRHRVPELVGGREVKCADRKDRDLVIAVLD